MFYFCSVNRNRFMTFDLSKLQLWLEANGTLFWPAVIILVLIVALIVWRVQVSSARAAKAQAEAESRAKLLEAQLANMYKAQNEIASRMHMMTETLGNRQTELSQNINKRLDSVTQGLHHNVTKASQQTSESLSKLHERLALIDKAQATIATLTGEVSGLNQILSNKQARGAFGQGRMESIIADALPSNQYSFQATLSNGNRPDCLVYLPNDQPAIAIDAKFPLEAFNAYKAAEDELSKVAAAREIRSSVGKHIKDISEKYRIHGETQATAFMFVPSESLYAELHESFEDVIQRSFKAGVVIVSPSLLMLSVQVMQGILKDARMREQAHLIQKEVVTLLDDVSRLTDRVTKLRSHFDMASKDIDQITTSTEKINKRGQKLIDVELGAVPDASPELPLSSAPKGGDNTIPFKGRE
jgi:DNA recombination protein RmuC